MPVFEAPRLETERLILRAHRAEDFDDIHTVWTAPEVFRHITGAPSSKAECWTRLTRYAGHWLLMGYGFWAVEDRVGGAYLGEVGIMEFRRDIKEPPETPEAGWVLRAPRGRGLAGEAMAAVFAWADAQPRLQTTTCLIAPENKASIRVAQKLGYGAPRAVDFKGEPTVAMTRVAPAAHHDGM